MVNPEAKEFREITVIGTDTPGLLANICALLGEVNINIDTISSERSSDGAMIKLGVDKEDEAVAILKKAGLEVKHSSVILANVDDKPGAIAKLTKKLADAGVNLNSVYLVHKAGGKMILALSADDMDKARQVVDSSY